MPLLTSLQRLRWDVPLTEIGLPRFGYERALTYLGGELSWWTLTGPLDDPGPGELSESFSAVRSALTSSPRAELAAEPLAFCVLALHEADLLRGGAPAIRLLKVRTACVEAAMARLLYPRSLPNSGQPKAIGGPASATTTT